MDDLPINLTNLYAACDQAETVEEISALMDTLTAQLNTLPQASMEAGRITSMLAKLKLKRNMLGEIVAEEPLEGGTQTGKRILTFADGTKAIWKPASGEGGRNRRKTK